MKTLEEARFHGRGGQGVVICSELIAQAAVYDGNFGRLSNMPFIIPKEDAVAKEIVDLIEKYKKPLVAVNVFGKEFSNVKVFEENGIPVYLSIQKAAKVVRALADYAHYLKSLEEREQRRSHDPIFSIFGGVSDEF